MFHHCFLHKLFETTVHQLVLQHPPCLLLQLINHNSGSLTEILTYVVPDFIPSFYSHCIIFCHSKFVKLVAFSNITIKYNISVHVKAHTFVLITKLCAMQISLLVLKMCHSFIFILSCSCNKLLCVLFYNNTNFPECNICT